MLEFSSHKDGDAQVFSLRGRLEFGDCPDTGQVLDALDSPTIKQIIIDLADLEFIDSAGVGLLIGFNKSAQEKGKTIALRGASGSVRELVELFQLDTVFEIH